MVEKKQKMSLYIKQFRLAKFGFQLIGQENKPKPFDHPKSEQVQNLSPRCILKLLDRGKITSKNDVIHFATPGKKI